MITPYDHSVAGLAAVHGRQPAEVTDVEAAFPVQIAARQHTRIVVS